MFLAQKAVCFELRLIGNSTMEVEPTGQRGPMATVKWPKLP